MAILRLTEVRQSFKCDITQRMKTERNKLTLIQGGLEASGPEGPVTRLGLWNRFRPLTKTQLAWIFIPKFILLATVFYFIWTALYS